MAPDLTSGSILADFLLSAAMDPLALPGRELQVRQELLSRSKYVRSENFREISVDDLRTLFSAYDRIFFQDRLIHTLAGRTLAFRLGTRLTRAGGKTVFRTFANGEQRFEISIAVRMVFDSFREGAREVAVCGVQCGTPLEALQRIFEHELVHLAEGLAWGRSNCRAERFQSIARRLFGHQSHTHELITQRERAAESGVHVGALVTFAFEGRELTGRVNRITRRATVLVEDPNGIRYSDGGRYRVYYVPISRLQPLEKKS